MKSATRLSALAAATAAALAAPHDARAVSLNPEGLGQALIFPYYTVRASAAGNALNTYISVGNSTGDAKAVRVRVREGRAGRSVLELNVYLSPNDVWTAAIVPTSQGAQLVTRDTTCVDPAPGGQDNLDFSAADYTGARADGFGDTLDRTREGYVEMIEMATLTGESRAAVTHNSAGIVPGCSTMRATATPSVAPPTGGLWGTLTLINVNSGQDFSVDATALSDLARAPFFRLPADPYPSLNSAEIDPVSVVTANGRIYRSVWSRPVDAVSAVLMRDSFIAEYVLDSATASLTDLVVTVPTRHFHADRTQFTPPFTSPAFWAPDCVEPGVRGRGEFLEHSLFYNREEAANGLPTCTASPCNTPTINLCATSGVASVRSAAAHMPADTTRTAVLGSTTRGLFEAGVARAAVFTFENGTVEGRFTPLPGLSGLRSLASSTRIDVATGQVTAGEHAFSGIPLVGFSLRTFSNGTLTCGSGRCQGNYGGAFPFKYRTVVSP